MLLSIGQLAGATGETVKTLRYWTDLGLLEAERGENSYRYYQPDTVERVAFIRTTQSLGFRLHEIRRIVELRGEGLQPCDEVRRDLAAHLATTRGRVAELRELQRELEARLAWAEAHPDPVCEPDGCVYLTHGPSARDERA